MRTLHNDPRGARELALVLHEQLSAVCSCQEETLGLSSDILDSLQAQGYSIVTEDNTCDSLSN